MSSKEPIELHKALMKKAKENPMETYLELSSRLEEKGVFCEFPEFAPQIHYMKEAIHEKHLDDICNSNLSLMNFRRHADLALWHVSQSEAWYPYGPTLRAIFTALQFLDTVQRTVNPELNEQVPFYHEFRYLYYFDYMINEAPNVILMPTYENITATTLVLTRGPPIFFLGISKDLLHVDEYKQTSAEFFIHDLNHGRRQYQTSLEDFHKNWSTKMKIHDYYKMQTDFLKREIQPLISLKDTKVPKGIKQLMKIILFEIIHEDAQPAYGDLICRTVLRNAGHGEAKFQVLFTNPLTGTPDIRQIKNPGGGILAFVKYKLRYGFLDDVLLPAIVEKEYRTTENIATAAHLLLTKLGCGSIPSIEKLMELTDNMAGQNPPAHPNHLGEPIDITAFTGKRPTPLLSTYFETLYAKQVPWTGIHKKTVPLERREVAYNAKKEEEETQALMSKIKKERLNTFTEKLRSIRSRNKSRRASRSNPNKR